MSNFINWSQNSFDHNAQKVKGKTNEANLCRRNWQSWKRINDEFWVFLDRKIHKRLKHISFVQKLINTNDQD